MRAKLVAAALFVFAVASACANLPDLAKNQCGNDVVDPPEDCDTHGNATGPGGTCITTGSDACHFACDPSVTDVTSPDACPSGYACSATGVCRRPIGAFDMTPTIVAGSTSARVFTGDFDGDHVADVVTVGPTSYVHFFDGRTEATRVPLTSVSVTPALGPLGDPATNTRTSAVVVSRFIGPGGAPGGNVRVWRGDTDRTLLPTVFPALDLTNLTQSLGAKLSDGRVIAAFRAGEIGSDIYAILNPTGTFDLDFIIGPDTQTSAAPQPLFQDVGAPSDIQGEIAVGRLGADCAQSPAPSVVLCQNFVVAHLGDTAAHLYPTCDSDIPPKVNLLSDPKHVAQIDLDLQGDTVAGAAFIVTPPGVAQPPSVFVVGAQHVWRFAGTACGISTSGTPVTEITPVPLQKVLAVGYIDTLDSCLDWVGNDGIHVTAELSSVTTACMPAPPSIAPAPWIDARIGDFNGNGQPDVVAISSTSLDFYNGSGSVLLNGEHTVLDGTPENLAVGDFDGDYVEDFVFDTTGDSTGLSTSNIQIAFGQLSGFPLAPQSVGRLDTIQQLAPAFFDYVLAGKYDFIQTVFAIEKDSTDQHLVASLLQGSPDRLINSPYFLEPSKQQVITSAVVATLGENTHPGIAGLSTGKIASGLWFVPAEGEAQLDVTNTALTQLDIGLDSSRIDDAEVAPIDVGGAPGQELAVLQPEADDGSTPSCFLLASVSGTTWNVPPCEKVPGVRAFAARRVTLQPRDVDGDGKPDLIVGYADNGKFAARVLFNDMTGSLSLGAAPELALPANTIAVTTIRYAKEGGTQLIALAPSGLWIARLDGRTIGNFDEEAVAFADDAGISTGTGESVTDLTVADVDGDGIDDAVVGTSQGFRVYHGVPQP